MAVSKEKTQIGIDCKGQEYDSKGYVQPCLWGTVYFSRGKFLEQGVTRDLALHPGNLIQILSFIYYPPRQVSNPLSFYSTENKAFVP